MKTLRGYALTGVLGGSIASVGDLLAQRYEYTINHDLAHGGVEKGGGKKGGERAMSLEDIDTARFLGFVTFGVMAR